MTELPPDPDDHQDELSDDTRDEVRRLLREEPLGIDPGAREHALAAALAAAVEPPLDLDPALPRSPGRDRSDAEPSGPPPASVTHLESRRAGRLRVLAIAAALVVVVGGVAAVNWGQGRTSSSGEETADAGKVADDGADADRGADDATSSAAPSESSGAGGAAEAPVSTTTAPGATDQFDAAAGLASLGSFDDIGLLFDAASALGSSQGLDDEPRAEASAPAFAGICAEVLSSLQVEVIATATFRDAPVLVVRATDPSGRPLTLMLSSPGCAVLAQG